MRDSFDAPGERLLPRVRRRILDGMGQDSPVASPRPEKSLLGPEGPTSGNTGIGGGVTRQIEPPVTPMPGVSDAPAPDPSQPAPMRKMPAPAPGMLQRKDGTQLPESQGAPEWAGIPRGEDTYGAGNLDWVSMLKQAEAELLPSPRGPKPPQFGVSDGANYAGGSQYFNESTGLYEYPDGRTSPTPLHNTRLAGQEAAIGRGVVRRDRQEQVGNASTASAAQSQPAGSTSTGYKDEADLFDDYARRGGSSGGAFSGAVDGASVGSTIGSVIPGVGTGVGAAVGGALGGIRGAFTNQADTAHTDFAMRDAREMVQRMYQQSLGRAASDQEIATHLSNMGVNPSGRYVGEAEMRHLVGAIQGSPEAQAYASRVDSAREGDQPATIDDGAATATASAYTRTKQNMPAGVDSKKWLSGHVSPKYAWKEVAGQHDLKTTQGREAALAQLKAQYPQYFARATWQNDKLHIGGTLHPDFNGLSVIDAIEDEDGRAIPRWGSPEQDAKNREIATARGARGGLVAPRGMEPAQVSLMDRIQQAILSLMEQGRGSG